MHIVKRFILRKINFNQSFFITINGIVFERTECYFLMTKNSDSKTESETSNLDSKTNEPSTPINISSEKCVWSCHKEIEHLKS